jgi:hypothetical protein
MTGELLAMPSRALGNYGFDFGVQARLRFKVVIDGNAPNHMKRTSKSSFGLWATPSTRGYRS